MSTDGPSAPDGVQRITTAQPSLSQDIAGRMRRYSLQMGIRLVCFVAVALLWRHLPVWVSVVLMAAAVVLPGVAVLFANAGRVRIPADPFPSGAVVPPAIGAPPGARGGPDVRSAPDARSATEEDQ